MFASFATIVLLAAGSFSPIQALDYLDIMEGTSLGDKNLDEGFEMSWKCTWLIFCELHHIMEAKTTMETFDNRTVMFLAVKLRALFPEIEVRDEEIFDTEAWKKRAEEIACSFSDEDKEKITTKVPLSEYASEVCDENREDREECDKLAAGVEENQNMITKYKEECAEYELNHATETK